MITRSQVKKMKEVPNSSTSTMITRAMHKNFIGDLLKILPHVVTHKKLRAKCNKKHCTKIRLKMLHIPACKKDQVKCPQCVSIIGLLLEHSKICLVSNCKVPKCNRFKEMLKEKEKEKRNATIENKIK